MLEFDHLVLGFCTTIPSSISAVYRLQANGTGSGGTGSGGTCRGGTYSEVIIAVIMVLISEPRISYKNIFIA